jgi:magnesium-transporting ATPase (P-type)
MYVKSTIVALKVDELADTLAKLTIGAARLQPEEKARLVALVKSLEYVEPIG